MKNNYLYNGKELLDEDADLGWLDYGFRNYDPQIGRFPQLDPLSWEYPYYTPYQFAGNDPIANVDLDGLEPLNVIGHVGDAIVTSKSLLQEVVITTAKIAKKISLSAGQITVKALQINNALNVIVTKPVTCHGAYQYGFSPYVGSMNSKSRWGIVLTSEEGGGNNAPKGETEDDPIKADLLMALLKSWMGNDPSFTKSIFEMIEKLPERILQVSESIKTFNDLIEKKIEDIYIARYKNNNLRKEFSKTKSSKLDQKAQKEILNKLVTKMCTIKEVKPINVKFYFNGKPAPNEKGPPQALRMSLNDRKPDTLFFAEHK